MKKILISLTSTILLLAAAAGVASACTVYLYQPDLPEE